MNGNKAKAQERHARIMELHRQGLPAWLIAERLGVTDRTVQRARKAAGITKPVHCGTEDDKLRAKQMLEDGVSYSEVARTLGFGDCAIKRWHPGYTYNRTQVAMAGVFSRQMRALEKRTKNNLVDC